MWIVSIHSKMAQVKERRRKRGKREREGGKEGEKREGVRYRWRERA